MGIIRATPAAKRLAQSRNIDLSKVVRTGKWNCIRSSDIPAADKHLKITHVAGRMLEHFKIDQKLIDDSSKSTVTKKDVLALLSEREAQKGQGPGSGRKPLAGVRKVIAQRMSQSLNIAPQYTLFSEIDATWVKALLAELNGVERTMTGNKLTVTDVMIKIAAAALKKHPIINTSIVDDGIVFHDFVNLGIAVALDDGLIVPNIKGADEKSLREICIERKGLMERARAGKLKPFEYTGGTFTISNLGMYPIDFSTPIINQPESGILGIGRMNERVTAVGGKIEIRPMAGISLTLDHRHIDGAEGAKFIATLKDMLENPYGICVK